MATRATAGAIADTAFSRTTINGEEIQVDTNADKAKVLAGTFFPPLPTHELFPPDSQYPDLLPDPPFLTRERIHQSIAKLKPYKAPGPDGIPNNGKPAYDTASAHHPIGLCNTIPKLHAMATADNIIYLAEANDLLPPGRFGGRPGRNTSDVKDAWQKGDVAAALFLDVKSAFPNMMKRIPTAYIKLVEKMLTERWTILKFDNFSSEMIRVCNGATLFAFYNAPLIDAASNPSETSIGFNRDGGGFTWSRLHNLPFELSKIAVMDFPRQCSPPASSALTLHKPNTYLGVFFDPRLSFKLHAEKAVSKATWWTSQLWRISKISGGMPPSRIKQLWNTVAVPAFTYAADVWYTGVHTIPHSKMTRCSKGTTTNLTSVQRKAAKHITGALSLAAADTLKILFRAAACICTLPPTHPLYTITRKAASKYVKTHKSPLHHLFHLTGLRPDLTETITPIRRPHSYQVPHSTHIKDSKENALRAAQLVNDTAAVRVYVNGSGYKGGISASAVLYEGTRVIA
ncbi:hypothetical protein FIBSPDRAFT_914338 [Athelia psychrophila]|uniref:Reverse transcriptase domain-containing protein n=1 Tax=Athelia psychrophila TaxID=1759441 RepID=A0A165X2F8_9AGAM|nr:hypothetical protein FIBSPDRAFT_914338 [Fibularhizoctonia sp. CBS 109695]